MRFLFKILPLFFIVLPFYGLAQQNIQKDRNLLRLINADEKLAVKQYKFMATELTPARFPKTYYLQTGKFETSDSKWWCSGFYPGTLLRLYNISKDTATLSEAQKMLGYLAREQYNTSTHDLGFMMYCSYGNALKFAPNPEYKEVLINSAKSLITRFNPKVGCIRSWDSKGDDFLVIIDNMMNLELLFWATKATGDSVYYEVAVTHANTTMRNHYRPDYSSYHVVNYNALTGEVKERKTAQGFANESAWARGQAWGLYGFTVMYRETHDAKYLEQANRIAQFVLNHPNLPVDKIPYWDFNAPDIPDALRDASAAAIMASALLELSKYTDSKNAVNYFKTAEVIIKGLSSPRYLAAPGTNGGFLLKHSVGHLPAKSEVDVPLTYADYYFLEALERYKDY